MRVGDMITRQAIGAPIGRLLGKALAVIISNVEQHSFDVQGNIVGGQYLVECDPAIEKNLEQRERKT